MLPESMPNCVCSAHDWKGNGGYVGPGMAYTGFVCNGCGRRAMEISAHYCGPLVLISSEEQWHEDFDNYTNGCLLVQWRAKEGEARKYYEEHGERMTPLPPRLPYHVSIAHRRNGKVYLRR